MSGLIVASCGSDRADYVVTHVDPGYFNPWVVVRVVSPRGEFFVVSMSDTSEADMPPGPGWEQIEVGRTYRLKLEKLDSIPGLRPDYSSFRSSIGGDFGYKDDWNFDTGTWESTDEPSVFWHEDKLVKPVFRSPDIRGEYVRSGLVEKQTSEESVSSSGEAKVDSVIAHHFAVLDTCVDRGPGHPYALEGIQPSLYFMMAVTGIEDDVRAAFFGPYFVEPATIQQWKAWLAEHRSSLRWDPVGDSVVVVK